MSRDGLMFFVNKVFVRSTLPWLINLSLSVHSSKTLFYGGVVFLIKVEKIFVALSTFKYG